MASRTSRNVIAAILVIGGLVAIAATPIGAEESGEGEVATASECSSFSIDFDDHSASPLTKVTTSIGPIAAPISAGTYDILLVSSDPTHAEGLYTDQLHESWYFTLDNGFTSAVTPDFGDAEFGTAIMQTGVTLSAASQITAHWAGQLPSWDSVHAAVTFSCVTVPTTTVPTTAAPTTTVAPTSTAVPTTQPPATSPSTVAPTSVVPPTTVAPTTAAPTTAAPTTAAPTTAAPTTTSPGEVLPSSSVAPTTAAPTTTGPSTITSLPEGEIGGITEENPDLARTGGNLNLALVGLIMVAAGFTLATTGSVASRRGLDRIEP